VSVGYDHEDRFIHYCHCGAWGAHGFDVSFRAGQLGVWFCDQHKGEYDGTEGREATRNARGESQAEQGQAARDGEGAGRQGKDQEHRQDVGREGVEAPISELWFTLEPQHIKYVDDIAEDHARRRVDAGSIPTNGQAPDYDTRLFAGRNGYRAEAAVRLWLGTTVRWTINNKFPGGPDFSDFIDVKNRMRQHHRLTITPECPSGYAYLLVCGEQHPRYRIVGWCWGHEAKQDCYWSDPGTGRPAWWVTENDPIMKPPDELLVELRRRQA
jgi:hypothetical protein